MGLVKILGVNFYIKRPFASDTIRVIASASLRGSARRLNINQYICVSLCFLKTWCVIVIPTVVVWIYSLEFELSLRLRFLHLHLAGLFCPNFIDRIVCTRLRPIFAWWYLVVCWHFGNLFKLSLGCCRYSNGHLFVDWALQVSVINWVICCTTDNAFRLKSWFHCAIVLILFFRNLSGLFILSSVIGLKVIRIWDIFIWNFIWVSLDWLFNFVSSLASKLRLLFFIFKLS